MLEEIPADDYQYPTNRGNLVPGGATKLDASPLQHALNGQGEQIDKLSHLFQQLATRLEGVRNSSPQNSEAGRDVEPMPPLSPLTSQVIRQTETVKNLQKMVNNLLSELEV